MWLPFTIFKVTGVWHFQNSRKSDHTVDEPNWFSKLFLLNFRQSRRQNQNPFFNQIETENKMLLNHDF